VLTGTVLWKRLLWYVAIYGVGVIPQAVIYHSGIGERYLLPGMFVFAFIVADLSEAVQSAARDTRKGNRSPQTGRLRVTLLSALAALFGGVLLLWTSTIPAMHLSMSEHVKDMLGILAMVSVSCAILYGSYVLFSWGFVSWKLLSVSITLVIILNVVVSRNMRYLMHNANIWGNYRHVAKRCLDLVTEHVPRDRAILCVFNANEPIKYEVGYSVWAFLHKGKGYQNASMYAQYKSQEGQASGSLGSFYPQFMHHPDEMKSIVYTLPVSESFDAILIVNADNIEDVFVNSCHLRLHEEYYRLCTESFGDDSLNFVLYAKTCNRDNT